MTNEEIEAELAKIPETYSQARIKFLYEQGWDRSRIAERLKVPYQKVRNYFIVQEHRAEQNKTK